MAIESVANILWQAAGQPLGDGTIPGSCQICGESSSGLLFLNWVRDTFTDWDKILPGEIICQPCQFAFAESSELLAARVGKDKPQRMRNYSHFVVGGEWLPLSKADKARMVEILRGGFEVAVIADSGQKHIIFRAIPGVVQFEEQQVRDVGAALVLLEPIEALYAAFGKGEIAREDYAQHRVLRFGLARWDELERRITPLRGSVAFELALFLAQRKEKEQNDGITPESGGTIDGGVARDSSGLQEPLPGLDLAAVRG